MLCRLKGYYTFSLHQLFKFCKFAQNFLKSLCILLIDKTVCQVYHIDTLKGATYLQGDYLQVLTYREIEKGNARQNNANEERLL